MKFKTYFNVYTNHMYYDSHGKSHFGQVRRYEGADWTFTGRMRYEFFTTRESNLFIEISAVDNKYWVEKFFWRFWKKEVQHPTTYKLYWKLADKFDFEELPEVTILDCGNDTDVREIPNE